MTTQKTNNGWLPAGTFNCELESVKLVNKGHARAYQGKLVCIEDNEFNNATARFFIWESHGKSYVMNHARNRLAQLESIVGFPINSSTYQDLIGMVFKVEFVWGQQFTDKYGQVQTSVNNENFHPVDAHLIGHGESYNTRSKPQTHNAFVTDKAPESIIAEVRERSNAGTRDNSNTTTDANTPAPAPDQNAIDRIQLVDGIKDVLDNVAEAMLAEGNALVKSGNDLITNGTALHSLANMMDKLK